MLLLVTVKDKIGTYTLISVSWPTEPTFKQQHTAHPPTSSMAKNSHSQLTFSMTEESGCHPQHKNSRRGSKPLTPPCLTIGSRLSKGQHKAKIYKSKTKSALLSRKETRSIVTWDNLSSLTLARCSASKMDPTSLSRHLTKVLTASKLWTTPLNVSRLPFMAQTFSWHTCLLLRFNPLYFTLSIILSLFTQLTMFIEDDWTLGEDTVVEHFYPSSLSRFLRNVSHILLVLLYPIV